MIPSRPGALAAFALVILAFAFVLAGSGRVQARDRGGLAGSTILLIRHAEKPADGAGLTPAGEARARAYATYFTHFSLEGASVHIDALIATADTPGSMRPRLTLTPLSQATGLSIAQPFADDDVRGLANSLKTGPGGRAVLIAWHHGKLPKLIGELGVDPASVLPGGVWPSDVYDWVVEIRYGADGRVANAQLIKEPAFAAP